MALDQILALGDDALANSFEVIIPAFPGSANTQATMLRVTSFELVGTAVGTYTIDYKTQKFTKPSGKNATPNEFTFTFRIDKYWQTYEDFENWKALILNDESGVMSPDVVAGAASLIRADIIVKPVDSAGTVTKSGWTYTGCFPSNVTGATFEQSNGDPLTATITMQFVKRVRIV